MPKMYHIFLSYSRTDSEMMRRITADLRRDGFIAWNDESLEPGTPSWKKVIQEAIESSQVVVALLSPDAKKSQWIERELDYARAQQVMIIPVIVRGETQSAVPFDLISVQRADVRRDYQAGFNDLKEALCEILKLPDLCDDRPETLADISQIQASPVVYQDKGLPGQPVKFAGTLRVWNPLDYVKLLYLYLFNPERLSTYEPNANRTLAVWLVTTLFWLPPALNVLAYRLTDVPLWGIEQQPLVVLPTWLVAVGWLLTGVIGQIHFEARSGLRAFLRGPLNIVAVVIGLGAALLYAGSIFYALPPLEIRDGLVYLLASQPQQLLIIAGGLSVFAGTILANNLARGFSSWLGFYMAVGFLALVALMLYIPLGATLLPALETDPAKTDITAIGLLAYSGVICCLGGLLWVAGAVTGGALRQRQVSGFNFLLLVMLVAAYGLLVWVHVVGK